nr:MAG TPA: hypothetical protein [Caudoviricetes sp.]
MLANQSTCYCPFFGILKNHRCIAIFEMHILVKGFR